MNQQYALILIRKIIIISELEQTNAEDQSFKKDVSRAFQEFSKSKLYSELRQEKKELRKLKSELKECDSDDEEKSVLN